MSSIFVIAAIGFGAWWLLSRTAPAPPTVSERIAQDLAPIRDMLTKKVVDDSTEPTQMQRLSDAINLQRLLKSLGKSPKEIAAIVLPHAPELLLLEVVADEV